MAALLNPANPNARPGLERQRRSAQTIGVALEAIDRELRFESSRVSVVKLRESWAGRAM